jgi:heat shock protein HtpX
MDIWHRAGRIFRISNLGTLIFFILNIGLILVLFCPDGITVETATPLVICYIITVLISLSPLGEFFFAAFAGAREIKRTDIKIRLIPLLEIVFEAAKRKTPSIVSSIKLKIIYDNSTNAFAIGRKTICVTEGLLNLSDEEIMAVLAHELGHIAYQHSVIQLLIGGSNLFVSGFLVIIKCVCWVVTGILTIIGLSTRSILGTIFMTLFGSLSTFLIWLWTKFCMLFLMLSMRQNEFVADEYAYSIGYGDMLAYVLDRNMCSQPKNGLLKALYSTHPNNDDRVARLQKCGSNYSRF